MTHAESPSPAGANPIRPMSGFPEELVRDPVSPFLPSEDAAELEAFERGMRAGFKLPPLPPKWSEALSSSAAADCDHAVWVAHIKGGEPLSVSVCQLCRAINWDLLREDFGEQLRKAMWPPEGVPTLGDLLQDLKRHGLTLSPAQEAYLLECGEQADTSEPGPVNTSERPEDAARRYAGQLLALRRGLIERNWDMTSLPEDEIVAYALAALDELDADAKANAVIAHEAGCHAWLGLATTKELLEELVARGRTEPQRIALGARLHRMAFELLEALPSSMLEYRTAEPKALPSKEDGDGLHHATWYQVELLKLQLALVERGVEEARDEGKVVPLALECLDEAVGAAKANAQALGEQDGLQNG